MIMAVLICPMADRSGLMEGSHSPAECVRLESGYTARYREFESRPLRQFSNRLVICTPKSGHKSVRFLYSESR